MGLTISSFSIDDFTNKENIYSKNIRGKLVFYPEVHNLDNGKHLQIYLYRDHPDIKKFIDFNEGRNYLTRQTFEKTVNTNQLKITINKDSFMIMGDEETKIIITEYNFNRELADFAKGKVCVFLDFYFKEEKDNKKAVSEIRGLTNLEENNETTINSSSW